jgi:hypothetical protein
MGAFSAALNDAVWKTVSSYSSSSQNPPIQVGSGGLAEARVRKQTSTPANASMRTRRDIPAANLTGIWGYSQP